LKRSAQVAEIGHEGKSKVCVDTTAQQSCGAWGSAQLYPLPAAFAASAFSLAARSGLSSSSMIR
jgi:hypothetical protein